MRYMFHPGPSQQRIQRHPVQQGADRIRDAFTSMRFTNIDNGYAPEVIHQQDEFLIYPGIKEKKPITFKNTDLMLRTSLLPSVLSHGPGPHTDRGIAYGAIYDRNGIPFTKHYRVEGYLIAREINTQDFYELWTAFAAKLLGVGTSVYLCHDEKETSIVIEDRKTDKRYEFIKGGFASDRLKSALKHEDSQIWTFEIDIDSFVLKDTGIGSRTELYSLSPSMLRDFTCSLSAAGSGPLCRLIDTLRWMGYTEYIGNPFYPDGIYLKMNMIQEKWDTNNSPYILTEAIEDNVSFATVLTPSFEKTIADFYQSGEKDVRIFEVGHIAKPAAGGKEPREKLVVALGGYGEDLDIESFKDEVGRILANIGLVGETFFPTNLAIAYKTDECFIMLDHKNNYLETNIGQMSPIAARNWEIGVPAFMAYLEMDAIENAIRNLHS